MVISLVATRLAPETRNRDLNVPEDATGRSAREALTSRS
jgi:hypothetical protein